MQNRYKKQLYELKIIKFYIHYMVTTVEKLILYLYIIV